MKEGIKTLAQLATPVEGGRFGKLLIAGGSTVALLWLGGVALAAFFTLLAALAAIYLIATRVLGLDVKFDPRAFWEQYSQHA
jgi:hypothetical protein